MAAPYHLRVTLYDTTNPDSQNFTFYDIDQIVRGIPFINLNDVHFADKAAMVVMYAGDYYTIGDKVVLLDEAKVDNTDTWVLDPMVGGIRIDSRTKVFDLNNIYAADKAAGLQFVINDNGSGPF